MSTTASKPTTPEIDLTPTKIQPSLLLLVYIHGFKGTDESFEEFPQRLEHILSETIPHLTVESNIFPAYETKGDLNKAVVRFADWLATLTVQREVASGLGAGKANIVLCGHSMGGLLAADTLRELITSRTDRDCPLWPKIIACIAYDTPYFGIHPFVVKHSVTKAAEYANAAKTVGSALLGSFAALSAKKATQTQMSTTPTPQAPQSSWGWAGPAVYAVGGAILAGAAAGGAYYKRNDLTQGLSWATEHMKYVGNLWDEEALNQRVEALIDIEKEHGVIFRTFYSTLPPKPPEFLVSRTFIVLPKYGSRSKDHFLPNNNGIAPDEVQAHTGIFSAITNDGYYELGLASVQIIREALTSSGGKLTSNPTNSRKKVKSART